MTSQPKSPVLGLSEYEVTPVKSVDATVRVLGSKSYTNRHLAMAGLSADPTTLHNALLSQDTLLLADALRAFGHVDIAIDEATNTVTVTPNGKKMAAPAEPVHMGNAGTPIRLLITMAALAEGRTVLTGSERMQERPMGHLLEALAPLGVTAVAVKGNDSPPIEVEGPLNGGRTDIHGTVSSQFTTSLLLSAPYAREDVEVHLRSELLSKPYVDMTVAALKRAGVTVERRGYEWFRVAAGQRYRGGDVTVEPDASGMSYFLAAAAVLDGRVTVPGIDGTSVQGDVGLVDALVRMGCRADTSSGSITLEHGGSLKGIDIDMSDMPDVVPTLAVVAAYGQGTTHITGIGNLRFKECDRIDAVSTELTKMGVTVRTTADTMTVEGGRPRGAVIDTYDDHRIAMAFAVAGLRTPGVVIRDPGCVTKSFPTFWERLADLGEATA